MLLASPHALGAADSAAQPQPASEPAKQSAEQAAAGAKPAAEPAVVLEANPWRSSFAVNMWTTAVSGSMAVGARKATVNESFIDLVQNSDSLFGINGRAELWYERIGGYVDGTYMRIGFNDEPTLLGPVNIVNEMSFVEFGLQFRLAHWILDTNVSSEPGAPARTLDLDVYAGGRYTDVGLEFTPAGGGSQKKDENWVDPLVGLRATIDLCPNWRASLGGDIGGFGVGSEFAWAAALMFEYRFDMWGADAALNLGYRALAEDRKNGVIVDRFEFDVILHGPIFGLAIRF